MRRATAGVPRCGRGRTPAGRGQTLLEFAIAITIFILLVGGVIEGCRLIYVYTALHHAAHEGARTAVLADKSEADVRTKVVDAAGAVTVASGNVTISGFAGRELGDRVTVGVTYAYTPVITMVFGAGPFTLSASSEMMVE